jgi:hypothetical protein
VDALRPAQRQCGQRSRSDNSLGGTIGSDTDILVARSTDGGITWTPPAALHSNAASDREDDYWPRLTTDGQGTWLVVWNSFDGLGGRLGKDGDILVVRSTDGGITWSAPEPLNSDAASDRAKFKPNCTTVTNPSGTFPMTTTTCSPKFADHDFTPQVATDAQGNWLAVWVHSGKRRNIRVARSTDAGVTWTRPADIAQNTGRPDSGTFPQVTTDAQGSWVAVWGDVHGGKGRKADVVMARSTDAGVTWTVPEALNTNASCDSDDDVLPQLTTDGQGTWIAVWQSSGAPGGPTGSDDDVLAALLDSDPIRCQSKAQQACINALNGGFAKVARAQDKSILRCLKAAGKGESATACLALPDRGADKARAKAGANEARRCSEEPPGFGPLDADTVSGAAVIAERAMLVEIFGADLDGALVTQTADATTAKCQRAVVKAVYKCQSTQVAEFNRCKKTALTKGGAIRSDDLASCLAVDPRGRVAKRCDPLSGSLAAKILPKTCGGVGLAAAFPGCGTDDPGELASCADEAGACQVCLGLNEADGISEDCDLFDDGVANESCQ